MYDVINLTSCFPPFYGINPLPLFLEIFIILVRDLFLKMVALADMIVVLLVFTFSHGMHAVYKVLKILSFM